MPIGNDVEQLIDDERPDLLDRDGMRSLALQIQRAAERSTRDDTRHGPRDNTRHDEPGPTGDVSGDASDEVAEPDDPYATATAEFYDLLATGHWDAFGSELHGFLAGIDATVGPVVDVGAGTGVGLRHLAAAARGAEIFAVEPSKAMRVALHARLTIDPALRARVTVDPRSFGAAHLPDRACAIVASAVLGHLSDLERHRLWRYIADRLPPGAPAVIEVLPPHRPIDVALTRYRELQVGAYTYEGWQSGEPADDRHMSWTMRYRVVRGAETIAEHEVVSRWRCFSPDDIRFEAERYRLTVVERGDCVVLTA